MAALACLWLPILTAVTLVSRTAGEDLELIAIAPNVFNVNEDQTVSVFLRGSDRATVTVSIWSHGQRHSSQDQAVNKDTQTLMHVRVDGAKLGEPDVTGDYYVQLRVQCTAIGFDRQSDVLVNKRTGTVFVQTDKTIYSPGQKVFVRIYALNEFRRGTNMTIRVEIKNPQDIIIMRSDGVTEMGYYHLNYDISERPIEGNWTIVAYFGRDLNESRSTQIEVRKYVLPHFQVQIMEMTEFICNDTDEINGKFHATYSFGTSVVGTAVIIYRLVQNGESEIRFQHKATLNGDENTFKLTNIAEKLYDEGESFQSLVGKAAVQVEVHVMEKSTGLKQTAYSHTCPIVATPYTISFEKTLATFSPGLPFTIVITVKHSSGHEWAMKDMEIYARTEPGTPTEKRIEVKTDKNGNAECIIDTNTDNTRIIVKVKALGKTDEITHIIQHSTMAEYMQLKPLKEEYLKPGDDAQFQASLTSAENMDPSGLHFMMVSAGRIFSVHQQNRIADNSITFRQHISHDMVPYVRIIAWYFSKTTGGVIPASVLLEVNRKCQTNAMVSKNGGGTIVTPSENFRLQFTGSIGAKVAMMAVDKSVYFLSNRSRLTRKKFFDEFYSQDLGCKPGGGRTAMDVFKLAGLTVISNRDDVTTSRREHLGCQDARSRGKRSTERSTQAEGEQNLNEAACCVLGEWYANKTQVQTDLQRLRNACRHVAKRNATNMVCRNELYRCCVKQAVKNTMSSQVAGRTDNIEAADDNGEMPFITDEKEATRRKNFKESWLINVDVIPKTGHLIKEVTVPDTITTWVIQAVTLSSTEGMCVAQPLELESKMDLFLKIHLPHTAVQGEQIELLTTVYNMHSNKHRVYVQLQGMRGVCSDAAEGKWIKQSPPSMYVLSKRSWTARWHLVPMEIGTQYIVAKLISSHASPDIETRMINVVPSGALRIAPILTITQEPKNCVIAKSIVMKAGNLNYTGMCSNSNGQRKQHGVISLMRPLDALIGTSVMTVKFLGDVMTPFVGGLLSGTEKQLRYPFGCGEQTMACVGPTVFTAQYLRSVNQLTGQLEHDAKKKIEQGIDRMMRFHNQDGGFTKWARAASAIWLTSFALKTFAQARDFTDKVDNNNLLHKASAWIMKQNTAEGMFNNIYSNMHHRNMAGGLTDGPALTAYVYIAILEAGTITPTYAAEIDKGLNRLADLANSGMSSYELALITLALAKRNNPRASAVNSKLLTKARNIPDRIPAQRYWPLNPAQISDIGSQVEVEATGYALLAQVELRPITESNAIVEWLLRQRYGSDLFKTTQTTVVSLQALSAYRTRMMMEKDDLDMTCNLKVDDRSIASHITINGTNRLVQQSHDVTHYINKDLSISCAGTGKAYAAIETSYYSAVSAEERCAFAINASAHTINGAKDKMLIRICTRLKDGRVTMQMPMIEVGIGSAYVPDEETLRKLTSEPKNEKGKAYVDFYETSDRNVVLYLSQIPSDENLCLQFEVTRMFNVTSARAASVKVYAYYEPEKVTCTKFYQPDGEEHAMLDVSCKGTNEKICKCLEKNCLTCYGYDDNSREAPIKTSKLLKEKACLDLDINFVFNATLVEKAMPHGDDMKYTMKILYVLKEGTEKRDNIEGLNRVFVMPRKCKRCDLVIGRNYLIMGQDRSRGDEEYQLSPVTYLMPLLPKSIAKNMSKKNRVINREHKKFIRQMKGCDT